MKVRAVPILSATAKKRSQWEIGCGEIENILKTAGFILIFLKKIAPSPAKFRKAAGKVDIKLGKPPENCWTAL